MNPWRWLKRLFGRDRDRDWSDYLERTHSILAGKEVARGSILNQFRHLLSFQGNV